MITIHEVEQGTDAWLELRAGKYTGSNAHKLLKHGARQSALTGLSDFKGNFHTKRGHILEDKAIELYQLIKKVEVQRCGFVTNTFYPSCGYSPDGLLDDRTLEVKCFKQDKHLQLYAGDIPLEVLAQCHFGMLICERPLCDLIIYNPEFAKRENSFYEPKKALKIIPIKVNRNISSNFKKILTGAK